MSAIEIVSPGVLTTVQDLGRPGWAHVGVPPSGAADSRSLERGNRLVGNDGAAAALETTLIGPRLRFHRPALVAITGLGRDDRPFTVMAGEELDVGRVEHGARAYVCVRGGIDVVPVLGSRSTDLLTGLGPAPLRAGDLSIGPEPATHPNGSPAPGGAEPSCASGPARATTGSQPTRSTHWSEPTGGCRRIPIGWASD